MNNAIEKAYQRVCMWIGCTPEEKTEAHSVYKTLKKLLDKETAVKAIDNGYGVYFCPKCKGTLWQIQCESEYCFRCGQKIKWTD